uniref:Uncharacterized protein n=1 Tax=Nicotiana tabacum TaxID=4097 RepID=A0A1S3YE90_TOBAC|nr:PREDICTED: uncharacterized protein LOC107775310 [Nicotiana tabacum]
MARQSHVKQGQRHGKARQGKAGQAMANDTGRFDQVGGDLTWAGNCDNECVRLSQRAAICGNDISAEQCQRQGWAQYQPWHKAAGQNQTHVVHKQQLENMCKAHGK